jgi:pimeloyl-[acyl-carrier protein] synthase
MAEMSAYIREHAADRRAQPREDLLTALVQAEEAGDKLTEQELVSTVLLLLFAGNETTTNLIGNGMLTLLRQRDAFEQLRANPALIRTAIEELLRYESPVQFTSRIASQPTELGGTTIKPGDFVTVILGAANRDPAQFTDPDRLDLARRPNRHIGFAHGIHFCLGAPLARAEGQLAISTILDRFPALELVSDEADWQDNSLFRGLRALRVVGAE